MLQCIQFTVVYSSNVKVSVDSSIIFISLHIRSDAVASWSGLNFGSKIPVDPILGFGPKYPLPPKIQI